MYGEIIWYSFHQFLQDYPENYLPKYIQQMVNYGKYNKIKKLKISLRRQKAGSFKSNQDILSI